MLYNVIYDNIVQQSQYHMFLNLLNKLEFAQESGTKHSNNNIMTIKFCP